MHLKPLTVYIFPYVPISALGNLHETNDKAVLLLKVDVL